MRLFLLSLIFTLTAITSSFAVNSPIAVVDKSSEIIEIQDDSTISKIGNWIKKSFNTVKQLIKGDFSDEDEDLLMMILVFAVPPLAMYMYEGKEWTNRVTLNLILTIFCWVPGIVHAAIVIFGKK